MIMKKQKKILDELKELINHTYENQHDITPCYKKGVELKYLDLLKLLPGTNCKKCGEPTCLAFAVKLIQQEKDITQCSPLFSRNFEEKQKKLLELLRDVGYKVPD